MKNLPHIASITITIICIVVFGWYYASTYKPPITTFNECAEAGFPILESYPARCITSDGKSFTQNLATNRSISKNIVPDIIK